MYSIVLSGPESTGKSTLTEQLANHYNGIRIPEYARGYVSRLSRKYNYNDVETIAKRQYSIYMRYNNSFNCPGGFIFFDTFLIITKVWFQEVYKNVPKWLDTALLNSKPNFVLLCAPDIDWKADGVRENADKRDYLFQCYVNELNHYQICWDTIQGIGSNRLKNAISIIDKYFKK